MWQWILAVVLVVILVAVAVAVAVATRPRESRTETAVSSSVPTTRPAPAPPPLTVTPLPPTITGLEADLAGTTAPWAKVKVTSATTAPVAASADGAGNFVVHLTATKPGAADLEISVTAPDAGVATARANTLFLRPPAVFSGRGDDVIDVPVSGYSLPVAVIQHKGKSNFVVKAIEAGGREDLLVNEIGSYNGTVELALGNKPTTTQFEIKADGTWQVSIEDLAASTERTKSVPGSVSGTGDSVLFLRATSPVSTMQLTHEGKSNFVVRFCGSDAKAACDLVVNEIGSYNGTVRASTRTGAMLVVTADGPWSAAAK